MKKILLCLGLLILITGSVSAQREEIIILDEREHHALRHGNVRVRGLVGLQTSLLNLDLTNLNNALLEFNDFDDTMVLFGLSGVGGFRESYRFGGSLMSGSQEVGSDEFEKAILKIKYGALSYEQGFNTSSRTDLAYGLMLGKGRMDLKLHHHLAEDFSDVADNPKGTFLSKNFLLFEPRVNLHYKINSFLGFDTTWGYFLTYSNSKDWSIMDEKISGGADIIHGPILNLKLSLGF